MPIHLPPISRRAFLKGSLAAGASALSAPRLVAADRAAERETWALLADTHIAADRDASRGSTNMAGHLQHVAAKLIQRAMATAGVLIDGDCAFSEGLAGDYSTLLELLRPVRTAGLNVHLTLGNHDHRDRFWHAVPETKSPDRPIENRHVAVVESPLANWFLLDSLMETNVTPGKLGKAQIKWLARELDARAQKPAIIVGHHHPIRQLQGSGLTDSLALFDVLGPRRQVKAYIFGHTHHWRVSRWDDIHLVNLPPVAYPFVRSDPSGWVEMTLRGDGASLQLHSIDSEHRAHGEKVDLPWRAA